MRSYTYKIRTVSNGLDKKGQKFMTRYLTVPREFAEMVPENTQFICEIDDDGIHYRPVEVEDLKTPAPSWAKSNGAPKTPEPEPEPPKAAKKASGRRRRPTRAKA